MIILELALCGVLKLLAQRIRSSISRPSLHVCSAGVAVSGVMSCERIFRGVNGSPIEVKVIEKAQVYGQGRMQSVQVS